MLKILGFYNTKDNEENRQIVPSSRNKLEYVIKTLQKSGKEFEIISASNTNEKQNCPKKRKTLGDKQSLILLKGFARGGWLKNKFSTLLFFIQLYFYLLFHVKKNDELFVYHSFLYMRSVTWVKKIKKCKLILEVEEIYGDALRKPKLTKGELRYFKLADAFVFPTMLLNDKVNKNNKPYCIAHGTYAVEPKITEKFNDGKIHCVYAGTFDSRKGGCLSAIEAGRFLDEHYHIHILGFGNDKDREKVLQTIDSVGTCSKCTVTFEGLLNGEEYIRFIQSCHIGLSTQNPDADFNDTSFPSKVLSYLTNGLRVVSVRIKALETSKVHDLLYYYDENTPEAIANAVKSVDLTQDYDSRQHILALDEEFQQQIIEVI